MNDSIDSYVHAHIHAHNVMYHTARRHAHTRTHIRSFIHSTFLNTSFLSRFESFLDHFGFHFFVSAHTCSHYVIVLEYIYLYLVAMETLVWSAIIATTTTKSTMTATVAYPTVEEWTSQSALARPFFLSHINTYQCIFHSHVCACVKAFVFPHCGKRFVSFLYLTLAKTVLKHWTKRVQP